MNSRLPLFPTSTRIEGDPPQDERLTVAGCDLPALAEVHGTPLYLYDQQTLDESVAAYAMALGKHYPGQSGLTYAGKAFLCTAVAQWAVDQGLWVDCTGVGELTIAQAAGVPKARILVHGVNKSEADLRAALAQAGTVVVDNLTELLGIPDLLARSGADCPDLWLRLRPGLAVDTHVHTQTGQETSKFGLSPQEAETAVAYCVRMGLPLTGLHFHQGSHFHDPAPLAPALESTLDLVAHLRQSLGWMPTVLCPGGGWGVAYHEDDLPHASVETYVRLVAETLAAGCAARNLPLPRLHLEPGRSLVAQAGVALYRVGAVKESGGRRWLLLDGGLADNPRPALYGARYSALAVEMPNRPNVGAAWLGGPYCESGDILIHDLPMPGVVAGELVAVPVSGAYQLSMGSNYNGARRPAVLWLRDGTAQLIQRREEAADLLRRDLVLELE
ncbi:MAG: diaminopimelate decarboxylase [Caldilineaceae bacterium]|nr:diaminopimelate decarboxylase [Caldilineaceae bacterium]MBP8109971.1 diaminopimelate decarboxylase [Caldilineaceae bacterium]MBP8125444.1 diaminopimelate decarboxylase [Caldilineaceae bacterium]MBP9072433.1 diaminopimelate decarboxylase [Caldilineaceae bacterium]